LILARNRTTYEVLLVDDQSNDETVDADIYVRNLRVIKNKSNIGYLRSNNKAVSEAKGKYICLLNNDTEVTSGWIDNAIEVFNSFDSVGAVGCKLLYPNGTLQEAGGLIWGNGAPWNYGKGQNANHPGYNYVRDADYLSAAALFVRKCSWKEVGGFSGEFAPAYYEDTDLAYKLRDAGYRTMYCPGSVVIHFEGGSNGVDENSGLKAYQKKNAEKFKSKWYGQFNENGEEGCKPHLEVDRVCKQRVLVIDANTPRINNDAGSHAAIQEIKMLRELGSKVTFFPLNIAHMGIHTEYLQEIGVECIYYPFFVSLEQLLLLRGQEFDLVYITRYEAVLSVIDVVKNHTSAKVIFNNADLHFMRELRETLQLELRDMSGPLATREMELKAINSTDLTLCYTESERAIITSHILRQDKVMCCPWVMKSVKNTRSFDERVGIAFLGGFQHRPNVFGVKYFVSEVMPLLVARMPDMVFHVYGSGMPADIEELQSPNVKIEGFVEDLSDVFAKARLFVCPLLTGAGLNGKIIDCIAHGLPAVVSPLTADGSGLVHKQNALIAEDVDDWVNYIELLYTDRELWLQYSARLRDLSEGIYSGSEGVRRMSGILERVGISVEKSNKRLFQDFAQ
jgi:GT2 family glycosyltransferase